MEERSLHTILSEYTKPQLEDIVDILGTPGSLHRSKAKLVEDLDSYLRGEPRRWLSRLAERDLRQLRELVHAGPGKVMRQRFSDYPTLLEVIGIVSTDDSEDNSHKIWINREVYDIVREEVDAAFRAGEKSGQFALERMGLGILNIYGILPTERFMTLLTDWYHGQDNLDRLVGLVLRSPVFKLYRYEDEHGDYMVSPCLSHPEDVFAMRDAMTRRAAYKTGIRLEEFEQAGAGAPYFAACLHTPEGMRLEELYRQLGYTGFDLTLAVHDTWVEAQYTDRRNDDLFGPLMDSPGASGLDKESWEACCDIVAEYANCVPKWFLYGRSAAETGKGQADWRAWWQDEPGLQPQENMPQEEIPGRWEMPEPTISDGFASEMYTENYPLGFAIPHVAPEDPCPCGSGLRYCRCHGRYLS